MLEMQQSLRVWDMTSAVFLDVFRPDRSRDASISEVRAMAGVSEPAFHEQPHSKEDVVWTFLRDHRASWMYWFEKEVVGRYEATGGGLEIIADVLQEGFEDLQCFGLAFVGIATENGALSGEPFVDLGEQKEHLRQVLEELASRIGLQHPDIAASAAVLVIERTIVWARTAERPKAAQTARLLFQCLQHA